MTYYIAKTVPFGFSEALERTTAALKAQGFGVITEIDVQETLRKKLDADFRPYRILGACNPELAYEALRTEDKVGTMLPCNVVVQQHPDGRVEVAAVDPVASMQAIDNRDLLAKAERVKQRLSQAIGKI